MHDWRGLRQGRRSSPGARRRLGLAAVRVCPRDGGDGHARREPRPGLLLDAAVDFDIGLVSSIMVGGRWSGIEAGKRAGCRTVFIDRGYTEGLAMDIEDDEFLSLFEAP